MPRRAVAAARPHGLTPRRARQEVTYSVVFADDWSRQLWVAALSSLVARDYETNVDPARDARKGRAAGAAAAGAAGGKDST